MLINWRRLQLLGHAKSFLLGLRSLDIVGLHLWQVELLRAQNGSGSSNSNPTYESLSGNLEVLHCPQADEGSSSAQSSFAVDCYSSTVRLGEVLIADLHELLDNVVRWSRSINEKEIIMRNSILQEVFLIIFFVVESNYALHVKPFEDLNILIRVVAVSLIGITSFDRTHKGHEFPRDDPIDVSVLNAFEVLVFLDVECLKIVPLETKCVFKTL